MVQTWPVIAQTVTNTICSRLAAVKLNLLYVTIKTHGQEEAATTE